MAMREALLGFFMVVHFIRFSSATVVWNNRVACGALKVADPLDACTPLRNKFVSNQTDLKRIVLITRGNCSLDEKLRNAQNGGFSAAIVYDPTDSERSLLMVPIKAQRIKVVSVSKYFGEYMKDHPQNPKGRNGEWCIHPLNAKASTVIAICTVPLSVIVVASFVIFGINHLIHKRNDLINHVKSTVVAICFLLLLVIGVAFMAIRFVLEILKKNSLGV